MFELLLQYNMWEKKQKATDVITYDYKNTQWKKEK